MVETQNIVLTRSIELVDCQALNKDERGLCANMIRFDRD